MSTEAKTPQLVATFWALKKGNENFNIYELRTFAIGYLFAQVLWQFGAFTLRSPWLLLTREGAGAMCSCCTPRWSVLH